MYYPNKKGSRLTRCKSCFCKQLIVRQQVLTLRKIKFKADKKVHNKQIIKKALTRLEKILGNIGSIINHSSLCLDRLIGLRFRIAKEEDKETLV